MSTCWAAPGQQYSEDLKAAFLVCTPTWGTFQFAVVKNKEGASCWLLIHSLPACRESQSHLVVAVQPAMTSKKDSRPSA